MRVVSRRIIPVFGVLTWVVAGCAAVLTGSASAAPPLWLLCTEKSVASGYGRFVENQCAFETPGGEWESVGLAPGKQDPVKIDAISMKLVDAKAGPLGEKTLVECNGSGSGGAGELTGPNEAVVREAVIVDAGPSCEIVEGAGGPCETSAGVRGLAGADLPWKQTLAAMDVGGVKRTVGTLRADGKGAPGWAITCKTILGYATDTCTYEGEALELRDTVVNLVSMVKGLFENGAKGTCSMAAEGSGPTGEIGGVLTILAADGTGLSINTQR
jgi:hypothetical protein